MKLEEKNFDLSKAGRKEVLRQVCVELGYCSLGDTYDRLIDDPPRKLSDFVDAIIVGEGLNPETTPNSCKRRMRDLVIEVVDLYDGRIW